MSDAPPAPLEQPTGLSFQSRITSVSEAAMPSSIAILGKYKVGKTTLAASAARIKSFMESGKKVLILEAETGTASIAEDYPEVEQFKLTTAAGLQRAVDELTTVPHDYGIIIIDTMDKFQTLASDAFLAGAGDDTRSAYGKLKKWTSDIVWKLHKADFLVIFLFHEDDVKNNKGNTTTTFKVIGSAKTDLGQVFDIIARLSVVTSEAGENKRVLQLGPATGEETGSRYEKKLPNSMEDPTMDKLFDLIKAKKPVDTTPTTESKE